MLEKNSFVLYHSFEKQLGFLTDEQAGRLIKAIFAYSARGEMVDDEEDGMVKIFFSFVANQMDIDNEKYEHACSARRENGKKGGRPKKVTEEEKPKKPNGFSENLTKAKKPVYEYDNEYEYENEDGDGYEDARACPREASQPTDPTDTHDENFSLDEFSQTGYAAQKTERIASNCGKHHSCTHRAKNKSRPPGEASAMSA